MLLLLKVILTLWVSWVRGQGLPCGPPRRIANGFLLGRLKSYPHWRQYTYNCDIGFEVSAYEEGSGGKWTNLPECTKTIYFGPPRYGNAILQGKMKRSYKSGERVTYRCPEDYQMVGSNAVECRGGIWIGRPTCKDLSCGSPPPVQNALIPDQKLRYRHGGTAHYECQPPWGLFGNAEVTCISGKWTDPPECKGLPCGPPPVVSNAVPSKRSNSYPHGRQYTYTCKPGFRIRGPASVECSGGSWSHPPECTTLTCPSPPSYGNAILNGWKKNSYKSGEQVTYRCPEHYQMDGSNAIECRGGIWIGRPTCKDLSCGSPPPVQNALLPNEKPRYGHGDSALYECPEPLSLFGNPLVTCLSGKWTDPPACKESTGKCGRPPPIANGDIMSYMSPFYAHGSSVEYQCQAFYVLEGNRRITCHDGEWSEPPRCLDPCVISEESMKEHNIEFRSSHEKKLYVRTKDYTEFRCGYGYHPVSPQSAFRPQCREGKLEYPTCV